ncbi:hypothetical protein [Aeromonas salmonicida]|uniref:hypothetical protein n=1 Tax=Aeromonas salmonicida TaxID=645 RepID=UPI003D3152E3
MISNDNHRHSEAARLQAIKECSGDTLKDKQAILDVLVKFGEVTDSDLGLTFVGDNASHILKFGKGGAVELIGMEVQGIHVMPCPVVKLKAMADHQWVELASLLVMIDMPFGYVVNQTKQPRFTEIMLGMNLGRTARLSVKMNDTQDWDLIKDRLPVFTRALLLTAQADITI